jgi:alpha-glucosidase
VEAPLRDLPVFVKAGSIIPMQSVIQNTTEKPDETLLLHVYAGKEPSSFLYYEDDGESYAFEKGAFCKRLITCDPAKKQIGIGAQEGTFVSKFRKVKVVLHGFREIGGIRFNGTQVNYVKESDNNLSFTFILSDGKMNIAWD